MFQQVDKVRFQGDFRLQAFRKGQFLHQMQWHLGMQLIGNTGNTRH